MDEPAIEIKRHAGEERAAMLLTRKRRKPIRRWLRRLAIALAVIVALPLMLSLVYRLPAVAPVSTLMLRDAVTMQGYDRRWVPIEAMGTRVVHSVMMSEDGLFCSHDGVDWAALNSVIEDALSGMRTRGASTITMQTVKNLYLWQGRSFVRKGMEIPLAAYFDRIVAKKRIMEIYLNIAEWGPGIYGVEAAAHHHFNRPARDLTARQAALLAVTLPNPHLRNPAAPSQGLNRLAATIERRADQAGAYIGCLR